MRNAHLFAVTLALVMAAMAARAPLAGQEKMPMPTIQSITPVLMVEEIEPCLKFWVERLGFEKIAEVPEGQKLGFVLLKKNSIELMLQSYASVAKDVPAMADEARRSKAHLYVRVAKLDEVIARLQGVPVTVPERKTFYGAREYGVREPGGHQVLFAEFAEAQ